MLVSHAIIASGVLAALLVAAGGLVVMAITVTVWVMIQKMRRISGPGVVPTWWDQNPGPTLSAPSDAQSSATHGNPE